MRDDTMRCLPAAPFAQLAEQLTLNQLASGIRPEETGLLEGPAAHSAVPIFRVDDCRLMRIIQRWSELPEPVKSVVVAILDSMAANAD